MELLETLREVGARADSDIDVADTALILAALDHPEVDITPYRRHLAEIAADAREVARSSDSAAMQIVALRRLMAGRHRYRGDADTYGDVRNANLIDVIDRRKGLPVALGILYIHAARAYGAEIVGLNFPSHFLIRISARGQRAIIDPFHEGRVMGAEDLRRRLKELHGADAEIRPDHYAPVTNRDILIRLQNNIKLRVAGEGNLARALDVLASMTLIAPDRMGLWWETAVVYCQLGNLKSAIKTLETFLASAGQAQRHVEIEDLLRRLRSRVN